MTGVQTCALPIWAYLVARAIQFFLPGVPQVYYVGLLAGHNDSDLLTRSGVGRDINRHHYSRAEIKAAMQRPVVQDLLRLIRLRNRHPAFNGHFELQDSPPETLALQWTAGEHRATLCIDLRTLVGHIALRDVAGEQRHALQASLTDRRAGAAPDVHTPASEPSGHSF